MKQLKLKFAALLAIAGAVVFTSCDNEEDVFDAPTISLTTSPANVNGVIEANVGDEINITANVTAAGGFNVLRVTGGFTQEYVRTTAGQTSFSQVLPTLEVPAAAAGGSITLTFTAVDDADKSTVETLTINVAEASINTSEVLLMGAQSAASPSFLNAQTFATYALGTSAANAANIDLIFFGTSNNGANFAAPNNTFVDDIFPSIANWSVKNATKFYGPLTLANYNSVSVATDLSGFVEGAGVDRISSLAVDQVYAFTARGKKGIFKVTERTLAGTDNTASTIKIEVKVED